MALSAQFSLAVLVALGVNGSGVSVRVGGIPVGRTTPGFVGGRVEVTKRIGALVGAVPGETVIQDVRRRMKREIQ
jgi:hypothetical protein